MRLFIGTPTHSLWTPEFGHSLAWLMAELAGGKNRPQLVHHAWMDGTILPGLRMDLASRALEMGATHILWIDCDMKFRPDNVLALLAHDKSVVAANYIRRLPPHQSTAINMDGKYLEPSKGLEQVLYAGMGLMVTKTEVFRDLPQPWFLTPWNKSDKDYVGEDVWFCKVVRDSGTPIWVDHDASIGVGHVAKTVLTIEPPQERILRVVN